MTGEWQFTNVSQYSTIFIETIDLLLPNLSIFPTNYFILSIDLFYYTRWGTVCPNSPLQGETQVHILKSGKRNWFAEPTAKKNNLFLV